MLRSEDKLWTYEEIIKEVKQTQLFSVDPKIGYAGITDMDNRWVKLWKVKGDKFEEIDVKGMVKIIAGYLSKHITLEKLLQDKLLHEPLETILQLKQRTEAKGEVKEKKGCYSLRIKGKHGPPLELEL